MTMSRFLARLIIRLSAPLAPDDARDRWREEWLAEVQAPAAGSAPRSGLRVLVASCGAPIDALVWRLRDIRADRAWSSGWRGDLRDVLREWRRAPVRTIATFACLTVGLAASLVTFAFVNTMFAGEIPGVRDRSTLGRIRVMRSGFLADPDIPEFRAAAAAPYETLRLAGAARESLIGVVDSEPLSLETQLSSGSFFDVLGTAPALGRLLQPADDRADAPAVAVISHALWLRAYGGRDDVVGRSLSIAAPGSEQPPVILAIVGVAPRGFNGVQVRNLGSRDGADRMIAWIPMAQAPARPATENQAREVVVVARLGGPRGRAADELRGRVGAMAAAAQSANWRARSAVLLPLYYAPVTDFADLAASSALMLSVPLTILLIVCVNVAALRLAGGLARRHELAIRASLGASRRRLVRLLVLEAAGITTLSAAAAWAIATQGLAWTDSILPLVVGLDWRVFTCAVALAAGVTLLAGLWPAARATGGNLLPSIAGGSIAGGASNVRVYRWLVVVQMALSVVLLLSGMLAVRSAQNLGGDLATDLAAPIATAAVTFADPTVDDAQRRVVLAGLRERIDALPGVEAAALSTMTAFNSASLRGFSRVDAPNDRPRSRYRTYVGLHGGHVSASYFDIFALPVLEGRTFTSDHEVGVAVITSAMRELLPADQPAVGTRLRVSMREGRGPIDLAVIGVVGNTLGLAEMRDAQSFTPVLFVPLGEAAAPTMTILARSADPHATVRDMSAIFKTSPTPLLVERSAALADGLDAARQPVAWIAWILGTAAAMALAVAAMGLWAVSSIGVSRRRREFGIRLAIGADRAIIARMLLAESMRVASIGALAGGFIAAPLLLAMRSEIVGVEPWDPMAIAATLGVLGAAALAASIGPARRAGRVDPLDILRAE